MDSSPDGPIELSAGGAAPPRRWSALLTRYQRKFKVGVAVGVVLVFLIGPPLVHGVAWLFHSHPKAEVTAAKSVKHDEVVAVVPSVAENVPPPFIDEGSTANGIVLNTQGDETIKLVPAPLPGLSQETSEGSLPRVSEDGRQPWQAYARPFNSADQRPRIAIVVMGVGLSHLPSEEVISRLPPDVTLAFDSQSPLLNVWCDRARQAGHETLLDLPMEPFDYPRSDPGPHALLTNQTNRDNLARLLWSLRQATGYIGITTFSGSRFSTDPEKLTPILQEVQRRGLLVFDARVAPHSVMDDLARSIRAPVVSSTTVIDQDPTPTAINAALTQLEQVARVNGKAIGIVSPLPATLDRLDVWLKDLPQRGIALAPLSAMVK